MNAPIQMPEELQKLEKEQGNLWSCSIPGYPHGILPFGGILTHLYRNHLDQAVPEELTMIYCRYCEHRRRRSQLKKLIEHQENMHDMKNAKNADHRYCPHCLVSFPHVQIQLHAQVCPPRAARSGFFRTWSKEKFRFEYHGDPKLLELLCADALGTEPTDSVVQKRLLDELREHVELEPPEQYDEIQRRTKAAEKRLALLKRADEILATERELSAARHGNHASSGLEETLSLQREWLRKKQQIDTIALTAVMSGRSGQAAASLSKSVPILSARRLAMYFPS